MVPIILAALVMGLGLLPNEVLASPRRETETEDFVQTAHLKFRAAHSHDAYELTVRADGKVVETGQKRLNVALVDAPDYFAVALCKFETAGNVSVSSRVADDHYTQQVVIDPPQPILSVRCQGMCVQTYGACYDVRGQPVGPCCNGFCMATRCRPWNIGRQ